MLDFEVFKERGARTQKEQPLVTIQKKGVMALNAAAFEALGSPQSVELLYAPKARTIGMRAADPTLPHTYNLRQPKGSRTRIVAAIAFLKHYDIQIEATERYSATMMGDVLAVDLTRRTEDGDDDRGERGSLTSRDVQD